MNYHYFYNSQPKIIQITHVEHDMRAGDQVQVSIDDAAPRTARIERIGEGVFEIELDGRRQRAYVAQDGDKRYVSLGGQTYELQRVAKESRKRHAHSDPDVNALTAAMPGQVVSIAVQEGEVVTKGQTLVILEAMKMELRVSAPAEGRVKRVLVAPGQVVERGQQLVEMSGES